MIVHGIPGGYVLEEGDILSIDCGAIIEGYHGDAAFTMGIGSISKEAQKLLEVTERLWAGIEQMNRGNALNEIGRAVQEVAEAAGFSVVREYVGHAIGTAMHEQPQVPNYWPGTRAPPSRPATCSRWNPWSTSDPPRPGCSTTTGAWSPPTGASRPISSTRSPSPPTAPRSSRSPRRPAVVLCCLPQPFPAMSRRTLPTQHVAEEVQRRTRAMTQDARAHAWDTRAPTALPIFVGQVDRAVVASQPTS